MKPEFASNYGQPIPISTEWPLNACNWVFSCDTVGHEGDSKLTYVNGQPMTEGRTENREAADLLESRMLSARVHMLYEQLSWSLAATLANAAILVFELFPVIPQPRLLLWFAACLSLVTARGLLWRRYTRSQAGAEQPTVWGRLFVAGTTLNGLLWGYAGYFFFVESSLAHQLFVAFALAGMTSGAVATLAPLRNLYLVFLAPVLLPFLVRLLSSGESIALGMGAMVCVYMLMMSSIARRQHLTVTESLRLRFVNLDLVENLRQAAIRQDEANRELAAQVAEKQLAQQSLLIANRDLEQRVRERTQELVRSEQALREADQRKDEFLALLGHELRGPLASLTYATQLTKHPEAVTELSQSLPELIGRQVELLNRLVADLLDVARINTGKIQLHNDLLDLRDVIARAVETSRPLIQARRHAFDIEIPPYPVYCYGDLLRLAQVVANLLHNAAKYTDEGGDISLALEIRDSGNCIRVRDTGCGIDPAGLSKIFDLFYQARITQDRSNEGLGIGLCLAKSLVEAHGGRLSAHSHGLGKGSEFVVHLPSYATRQQPAGDLPTLSRSNLN